MGDMRLHKVSTTDIIATVTQIFPEVNITVAENISRNIASVVRNALTVCVNVTSMDFLDLKEKSIVAV